MPLAVSSRIWCLVSSHRILQSIWVPASLMPATARPPCLRGGVSEVSEKDLLDRQAMEIHSTDCASSAG